MFPPHPFTPDRLTPPHSLSSSAYSTPYSSQWDSVPSPRPQRPSPRSTPTAFQRKTLIAAPSIVPKAPLIGPKTPKIRSPPPDSNNAVVHSTEEACSSRTPPPSLSILSYSLSKMPLHLGTRQYSTWTRQSSRCWRRLERAKPPPKILIRTWWTSYRICGPEAGELIYSYY